MRIFLLILISIVIVSSQPLYPGYIPDSIPWDNPVVPLEKTPTIPSAPDCVIRPQVVNEIKKMRMDAGYIASMIEKEVHIMERRKLYVEQMTAYLNDRIKELNQVKSELRAENRWITVMQARIQELAEKERYIKLQDIQDCLREQTEKSNTESKTHKAAIESLKKKSEDIKKRLDRIGNQIKSAECPDVNGKEQKFQNGACVPVA